jgi:uncharacterized protein YbaA (DUF1428 family)
MRVHIDGFVVPVPKDKLTQRMFWGGFKQFLGL